MHTNYFSWEIINKHKTEDKRHIEDKTHGLDWIGQKTTGTLDLAAEMDGWIWNLKGISFLTPGSPPENDSALFFQSWIIQSRIVFKEPNE